MSRDTFGILFWINKSKIRKDGLAPIYCRITIRRRRIEIATHHHILPDEWRDKNTSHLRAKNAYINESLSKLHKKIFQIKDELMMSGGEISPRKIKETLLNNHLNLIVNKIEIEKEQDNYTSSFNEMGLSTRSIRILASWGIYTFKDLTKFSRHDISKLRSVSDDVLKKIDIAMQKLNISWKPENETTNETFKRTISLEGKIINKERRITIKILENILKSLQSSKILKTKTYILKNRLRILQAIQKQI